MPVPIQVQGPFVAAQATGMFPLFATGRALAARIKGVPNVPAGTHPTGISMRFPVAFWTGYFFFFHLQGVGVVEALCSYTYQLNDL